MRISNQMIYNGIVFDLQKSVSDMTGAQEQMGTGQKVNRPSDDPGAMSLITGYKTQLSGIAQYQSNINSAKQSLTTTDTVLTNLQQILSSVSDIAVNGGTMTSGDRTSFASSVDGYLGSAAALANTQVGGKYIFSGYNSNQPAIDTSTGEYQGASGKVLTDIAPGVRVVTDVTANELFSFKRTAATDPATAVMPAYNWKNPSLLTSDTNPSGYGPKSAYPSISALYTTAGVVDPTAAIAAVPAGGTLSIDAAGTGTPVAVTIGANSSLNNIRDAINGTAGVNVTAAVVNYNTTGDATKNDYHLVISSNAAANSGKVTIGVTGDAYLVGNFEYDAAAKNMTLKQSEPGTPYDADPVSALEMSAPSPGGVSSPVTDPNALNSGSTNGGTVNITLDGSQPVNVTVGAGVSLNQLRDTINTSGAPVKAAVVNVDKTGTAPDYRLVVASSPAGKSDKITMSATTADTAGSGLNLLAYDATTKSMTLGTDITNYNYITDPGNPNYYSFNNNYLNGNNVLRAFNFLKESMLNNDNGRIGKAVDYLSKLQDKLQQVQVNVSGTMTRVTDEGNFQTTRDTDITGYLADKQQLSDADFARLSVQLTMRQAALDSLRKSSEFMKSSLFDFM